MIATFRRSWRRVDGADGLRAIILGAVYTTVQPTRAFLRSFSGRCATTRSCYATERTRDQFRDPLAHLGAEDGIAVREEHESWALPMGHRVSHSLHRCRRRMCRADGYQLGKAQHAGLRLGHRERGVVTRDDLIR